MILSYHNFSFNTKDNLSFLIINSLSLVLMLKKSIYTSEQKKDCPHGQPYIKKNNFKLRNSKTNYTTIGNDNY